MSRGNEAKPKEPNLSLTLPRSSPLLLGNASDQNVLTFVLPATNHCLGPEAAFSNALPLSQPTPQAIVGRK